MSEDNENQQEVQEVNEIFHLCEIQQELIKSKSTLEKVLKKFYCDEVLVEQIYKGSGDSATTSIWYLQQVIKYLEIIITNNKVILDATG